MFANISNLVPQGTPLDAQRARSKEILPPTPVRFPNCIPQALNTGHVPKGGAPLVSLLRNIQRPPDLKIEHLQALGLHVIPDAPLEDVVPDRSYLPPTSWASTPTEAVEDVNPSSMHPLNNGRDSPGVKTYLERIKELSTQNDAAFRTIRRQSAPPGEQNARLGNAYEFFKYLELLSGFWVDTSLPTPASHDSGAMDIDSGANHTPVQEATRRIGTGSQTPAEFRASLLSSFTKLVAYDFGCNVSLPRIEPRLYISTSAPTTSIPTTSSFPTNVSFVYRTPTARIAARSGIVEGPVAGLSARPGTGFHNPHDSIFDLCREVSAVLVTAQQRSRENKTEKKLLDDLWWCHKPRWGGGPGGPIGREADKVDESGSDVDATSGTGPGQNRRSRKQMSFYDNYRMLRPPSSTWDRKTKYVAIGKPCDVDYDDVFLLSCLNHHLSIVRVRVPLQLLDELEGQIGFQGEHQKCVMWRSKWYDMFLAADRVEAMTCIWGMMAYMMRMTEDVAEEGNNMG